MSIYELVSSGASFACKPNEAFSVVRRLISIRAADEQESEYSVGTIYNVCRREFFNVHI